MKQPLKHRLDEFVADSRNNGEGLVSPDVASAWEDDQNRSGSEPVTHRLRAEREGLTGMDPAVGAGDPDVDLNDAMNVGEEAVGGGNPTPGQDMVDDIGRAAGLVYEDAEPLHTTTKLESRDRNRWELNPVSSEDFHERAAELHGHDFPPEQET